MRVVFKDEILIGGGIAGSRQEAFIVVGVFILIPRNCGAEQGSIYTPCITNNVPCAGGGRYHVTDGIISPSLF